MSGGSEMKGMVSPLRGPTTIIKIGRPSLKLDPLFFGAGLDSNRRDYACLESGAWAEHSAKVIRMRST